MAELAALAGFITAVSAAAAVVRKLMRTVSSIVEGVRCQLRTDMLRVYYRHKDERVIRQYEKENFEHNYRAYKALGGNSFIDDIHGQVRLWQVES